jgi:hypothetical protein
MVDTLFELDAVKDTTCERHLKELMPQMQKTTGHPFSPMENRSLRGLLFLLALETATPPSRNCKLNGIVMRC